MIRRQDRVAGALAALAIAVFVATPFAALAREPDAQAFALLGSSALWKLLAVTVTRALAIAGFAVVLGVPLGFVLARCDVRARRIALIVHAFPVVLPPFLLALGWLHAFAGSAATSLLFATPGVIAVLVLAFTPIVTILTVLALDGIDPALVDAARVAASPWRVATRILLPIAWPSAALGALVVFALAVAELAVPMFLRVDAYSAAVFARLGGIDFAPGEALVLVLPLLGVALLVLGLERSIARRPSTILGTGRRHEPFALGRWRIPVTLVVWCFVALGLVPIAAIAAVAAPAGVGEWIGDSLRNSVVDGIVGATAITILGLVIGHALARRRRGAAWLDAVAVLAFVTPAAVVGVGLIAAWHDHSSVYTTSAIVVFGYLARYLVIAIRPMAIAIRQAPPHLEEAAAVAGAGFVTRLARIVVPIHRRAIAGAWLLAFVFCLRDETAILYYPPGGETLPVRIFTLEANGPPSVVASLALIQVAITAVAVAAIGLLVRRART